MARIPRSSRTTTSSGRVAGSGVSISPSIADTGQGLEAAALGSVGKGVTDLAIVMKEIKDRDDKNKDSLTASENEKNLIGIEEGYEKERPNDSLLQTKKNAEDYFNSNSRFDKSKYINKEAGQLAEIEWETQKQSFLNKEELFGIKNRQNFAVNESEHLYLNKPTPDNRDKLLADLATKYGEKEAELRIIESDKKAETLRSRKKINQDPTREREFLSGLLQRMNEGKKVEFPLNEIETKQLIDEAKQAEKQLIITVENDLHESFIDADATDMTPAQLKETADAMRSRIENDESLQGKDKTRLKKAIKTWERDEGSMNFSVINSLNQRIDQFIQSGVTDVTLEQDIVDAKLDGSFGSREGAVTRDSGNMLKRLNAAEFKTNFTATAGVRASFGKSRKIRQNPNAAQLEYLLSKDIREELTTNDLNDAQSVVYAQTRANMYESLTEEQVDNLVGARVEGKGVKTWLDLPRDDQERDILSMQGVDSSVFTGSLTSRNLVGRRKDTVIYKGWTLGDVKEAKKIFGDNEEVSDKMIKEFGTYLSKKEKARFEISDKLQIIQSLDDKAYEALPPGTVFQNEFGKPFQKPFEGF